MHGNIQTPQSKKPDLWSLFSYDWRYRYELSLIAEVVVWSGPLGEHHNALGSVLLVTPDTLHAVYLNGADDPLSWWIDIKTGERYPKCDLFYPGQWSMSCLAVSTRLWHLHALFSPFIGAKLDALFIVAVDHYHVFMFDFRRIVFMKGVIVQKTDNRGLDMNLAKSSNMRARLGLLHSTG